MNKVFQSGKIKLEKQNISRSAHLTSISIYTVLFTLLCGIHLQGYGHTLYGKILDANNQGLIGAHIMNEQKGIHAHSDINGWFTIEGVDSGDTLIASFIGYESKNIVVENVFDSIYVVLEKRSISLDEVVISSQLNALNLITEINIQNNPVNSSQELLRQLPGLFIGQHAGGGKAEQLFLRGFDIDHGTDVAIQVDGMPVNMVSHAHGQGYSDLHFVIPETIDNIDFGKGPYFAKEGNFNTAGYVRFNTKQRLEESQIKLEAGQFNSFRLLGLFNVINTDKQQAYLASEYQTTDGPFISPQNFNRINLFGKYRNRVSPTDYLGLTVSYFSSKWDASGQIPQRAVDRGDIDRFGAIDNTEGGNTGRTNVLLDYQKNISQNSYIKNTVYYYRYDFELFSNFTFFLEDSINGDQIKQREFRNGYGMNSEYHRKLKIGSSNGDIDLGLGLRNDESKENELSKTLNRKQTISTIQLGNITETNINGYGNVNFYIGKWRINPGIRVDHFIFQYNDDLATLYRTLANSATIVSPKLNLLFNYSKNLQFFAKAGKGFHSNDTRVAVRQPSTETIPDAYGADGGFIWKPIPELIVNAAYWYLYLEQEFVYVGDAGIVEPSGRSQRQGVDLSLRYQPIKWLFADFDANYAYARSLDDPVGLDYIPLAPELTITGGITFSHRSGVYGSAKARFISDRPANEDNSIVAPGYTVVDANLGYKWRRYSIGLNVQNLLNEEWNETQFATESRLNNETQAIEEIHFTPGTPFFLKGMITYSF